MVFHSHSLMRKRKMLIKSASPQICRSEFGHIKPKINVTSESKGLGQFRFGSVLVRIRFWTYISKLTVRSCSTSSCMSAPILGSCCIGSCIGVGWIGTTTDGRITDCCWVGGSCWVELERENCPWGIWCPLSRNISRITPVVTRLTSWLATFSVSQITARMVDEVVHRGKVNEILEIVRNMPNAFSYVSWSSFRCHKLWFICLNLTKMFKIFETIPLSNE